jgi:hypothetical protein
MIDWWESDKYYQELEDDEKVAFLSYIGQTGNLGPSFTSRGKHFGQLKNCPTCKMRRVTSCVACGCGSCFTCGYRWSCYGPYRIDSSFKLSNKDKEPQE